MAQREILRARWRPDGVGLDESEPKDGRLQRGRSAQAANDGQAAQRAERKYHRCPARQAARTGGPRDVGMVGLAVQSVSPCMVVMWPVHWRPCGWPGGRQSATTAFRLGTRTRRPAGIVLRGRRPGNGHRAGGKRRRRRAVTVTLYAGTAAMRSRRGDERHCADRDRHARTSGQRPRVGGQDHVGRAASTTGDGRIRSRPPRNARPGPGPSARGLPAASIPPSRFISRGTKPA